MRRLILISMLIIPAIIVRGQNLVPNPGFEIYNACPSTYGELERAVPWNKPTTGSTDYFNACNSVQGPWLMLHRSSS